MLRPVEEVEVRFRAELYPRAAPTASHPERGKDLGERVDADLSLSREFLIGAWFVLRSVRYPSISVIQKGNNDL